jgi:hypothetical protein
MGVAAVAGVEEFGVVGVAGFASCFSAFPILPSFGGDALRSILGAGAPPLGHHRGPVCAAVIHRRRRNLQRPGGGTQAGEQQRCRGW